MVNKVLPNTSVGTEIWYRKELEVLVFVFAVILLLHGIIITVNNDIYK